MQRGSGMLLHVSSLPGEFGCGTFGKEARETVDLMKECGFKYWQVLPFMIPNIDNSPYKSVSAFAGNPFFIDLEMLAEEGLLTRAELDAERQSQPYAAEYERLKQTRLVTLKRAAERALADKETADEVEKFIKKHPQIDRFCEFIARKEANGDLDWREWTTDDYSKDAERAWRFIQYEFFRQWHALRGYANDAGIKIIGDIPIYVDGDSADVWANRDMFLLDRDGHETRVAGCPPDYFSEDGQLWGNPIYDWKRMERDGFKWWEERLRSVFELFDAVRIDHFRGFASYWSIPADAETAKDGEWVVGPREAFVDMVKRVAEECSGEVIAEDLGENTPDVEELLEYSGFPGMRVMQFGFMDDSESTHQPHTYPRDCVAYTGTHDNNTLLGYLYELEPMPKKLIYEYCGYEGSDLGEGVKAVLRTLLASTADVAMAPVQDLLGYGKDTRMNTPGVASGMWRFRITKEQLAQIPVERLARWNHIYRR